MGNSNQPPKEETRRTVASTADAKKDAHHSEDPLFVLYGAPDCIFSMKAAELLVEKQQHHCKIGTNLLKEAVEGSHAPFSGTTPQVFSCPSAELLAEVAGSAPGALGATAHGAVATNMCKHVGGYSELLQFLKDSATSAKQQAPPPPQDQQVAVSFTKEEIAAAKAEHAKAESP
mmetsp:Transcript_16037/g.32827  ORF Transcript_16037/g.32827 Transcript_16037/m.32827 type:complete len:174 (-) Transcript_16037:260-781(-)